MCVCHIHIHTVFNGPHQSQSFGHCGPTFLHWRRLGADLFSSPQYRQIWTTEDRSKRGLPRIPVTTQGLSNHNTQHLLLVLSHTPDGIQITVTPTLLVLSKEIQNETCAGLHHRTKMLLYQRYFLGRVRQHVHCALGSCSHCQPVGQRCANFINK